MARRRMIDPSIWEDPDVGELDDGAWRLFVALISNADDEGRLEIDLRHLRRQVFGYQPSRTERDVERMLDDIGRACRNVRFYEFGGRRYCALLKWREYQSINKPTRSKLPAPPEESDGNPTGESDKATVEVPEPSVIGTDVLPDDYRSATVGLPPKLIEEKLREEKHSSLRSECETRARANAPGREDADPLLVAVVECCGYLLDAVPQECLGEIGLTVDWARARGITPAQLHTFRERWTLPSGPSPRQIRTQYDRVMDSAAKQRRARASPVPAPPTNAKPFDPGKFKAAMAEVKRGA
jgi:hypothetical protein